MPDRQDLIDDVRRMAEELDRKPHVMDVTHASQYDREDFREEFGKWRSVIRAALDTGAPDPTREELLMRIIELHVTVESDPSIQTWNEETLYNPHAIYECPAFDGWPDAKQQAGIVLTHRTILGEDG